MSAEGLHKRDRSKGRATMREKLVQKHSAADEHERNFNSGRVNVHERYLHRTGIRGRKIWIFFAILFFLTMIVLINLLVLVIMFHTLQMSKDGMKSLSFLESGTLRWMQSSDLGVVTSYTGQINAFSGQNLDIQSDQEVFICGGRNNISAQVHVGHEETTILAKKGFRFVDPYIKKTVIHFDSNKMKLLPHQITSKKVVFNMMETHRVVTNEDQNLHLFTDQLSAEVRGNEGVYLDGKNISLSAKNDINISSAREIIFDAKGGFHFNKTVHKSIEGKADQSIQSYKLCACINTGQFYRVRVVNNVTTCRTAEKIC